MQLYWLTIPMKIKGEEVLFCLFIILITYMRSLHHFITNPSDTKGFKKVAMGMKNRTLATGIKNRIFFQLRKISHFMNVNKNAQLSSCSSVSDSNTKKQTNIICAKFTSIMIFRLTNTKREMRLAMRNCLISKMFNLEVKITNALDMIATFIISNWITPQS